MPTTHIAKYPIVDPNPSMGKIIYNFNFTDYTHITMFAVSGAAFGWFGASKLLRRYNSRFLTGIGLWAGFNYAVLSSTQRLIGLYPNQREVELYGVASQEDIDNYRKMSEDPTIVLINSEIFKRKEQKQNKE